MNTKIVMTASAIILCASGIVLTFAPEIVISNLKLEPNKMSILLGQIIGGLYFAFGMLNWMSKGNLIGGIYNRPIAIANLSHFLIVGLAITKGTISNPDLPYILWVASFVYLLLAVLFWTILRTHPINSADEKAPAAI